jgi:hypothetical protein
MVISGLATAGCSNTVAAEFPEAFMQPRTRGCSDGPPLDGLRPLGFCRSFDVW